MILKLTLNPDRERINVNVGERIAIYNGADNALFYANIIAIEKFDTKSDLEIEEANAVIYNQIALLEGYNARKTTE